MIDKKWIKGLEERLNQALKISPVQFSYIKRSDLQRVAGVYIISTRKNGKEEVIYVGRTKTMQGRLYGNHLNGNKKASSLKRYLIQDTNLENILSPQDAKQHILENYAVRFVLEEDLYMRGILECYFTAVLRPMYAISPEH